VEEVCADFEYPEKIAEFVHYLPMSGRDLGSREANVRRLFERWREHLASVASTRGLPGAPLMDREPPGDDER